MSKEIQEYKNGTILQDKITGVEYTVEDFDNSSEGVLESKYELKEVNNTERLFENILALNHYYIIINKQEV